MATSLDATDVTVVRPIEPARSNPKDPETDNWDWSDGTHDDAD